MAKLWSHELVLGAGAARSTKKHICNILYAWGIALRAERVYALCFAGHLGGVATKSGESPEDLFLV
jgi:hypothetical protein